MIYWIDDRLFAGRLAIMARPRAGDWLEDEISAWRRAGVSLVVSLLEDSEVRELGLGAEARLCEASDIRFRSFPIADRGVPVSYERVLAECRGINDARTAGLGVAMHCRAGIGRSSVIVASSLALAGVARAEAFSLIQAARRVAVPDTQAQVDWVEAFADFVQDRK